jgi:Icc protein
VILDLTGDGPAAFNLEPHAVLLHVWDERLGLVSHTSYVGDFGGPHPFFEHGRLITD